MTAAGEGAAIVPNPTPATVASWEWMRCRHYSLYSLYVFAGGRQYGTMPGASHRWNADAARRRRRAPSSRTLDD